MEEIRLEDYNKTLSNIIAEREVNSTSLERLYSMWVGFFFDRILRIFEYENLTFPQRELEGTAILNGISYMAYTDNGENGFVTRNGSVYGVTRYPDVFTTVIYAMPKEGGGTISGKAKVGEYSAVLYNTSNGMSLMPFIERYASLATHIDLTLKCRLINDRYTDILLTSDSGTTESLTEYYDKKYKGIPAAVLDESLLLTREGTINLANNRAGGESSLQLIQSHNELLRSFYRDIGLKVSKEKTAEMTSFEVDANDSMLLFNINDMLRQRKKFCEECNRIFKGLEYKDLDGKTKIYEPISVKLNEEFSYNIGGVNNEGEANNRTMDSYGRYTVFGNAPTV